MAGGGGAQLVHGVRGQGRLGRACVCYVAAVMGEEVKGAFFTDKLLRVLSQEMLQTR